MDDIKKLFQNWLPPALYALARRLYTRHGYYGNFSNWEGATQASEGYASSQILDKVKDGLLKVKRGEAVYERDSVLFDHIEYSWPVLTGLLLAATQNGNRLNVLDFGGSLGSTYFQNRKFLSHLDEVRWNVVEQQNFVSCGQEFFQDKTLRFYSSIDECLNDNKSNVLILSSVLPYLEDVYGILASMLDKNFPFIIVDRTHVINGDEDRIMVQRVPARIYKASYPCRFFNEAKLVNAFTSAGYEMLADFESLDSANIPSVFKGFIFANTQKKEKQHHGS